MTGKNCGSRTSRCVRLWPRSVSLIPKLSDASKRLGRMSAICGREADKLLTESIRAQTGGGCACSPLRTNVATSENRLGSLGHASYGKAEPDINRPYTSKPLVRRDRASDVPGRPILDKTTTSAASLGHTRSKRVLNGGGRCLSHGCQLKSPPTSASPRTPSTPGSPTKRCRPQDRPPLEIPDQRGRHMGSQRRDGGR